MPIKLSNHINFLFIGPGVGAWLYEMGGFMLPFLVVGAISIVLSLSLIVTIPNLGQETPEEVEPLIADASEIQLRFEKKSIGSLYGLVFIV